MTASAFRMKKGPPGRAGRHLPVVEQVIADKPNTACHGALTTICRPTIRSGIRMPAPELYNRASANLSVARGTLSEEERFKINDHIVQTLVMLDQPPYPGICARCRRLPAGTTRRWMAAGYPRRLQREADEPASADAGHRRHLRGAPPLPIAPTNRARRYPRRSASWRR